MSRSALEVRVTIAVVVVAFAAAFLLLGHVGPKQAHASGPRVGPGPAATLLAQRGYRLRVTLGPNRASLSNRIAVEVTRAGAPVPGCLVRLEATMLAMRMPYRGYDLVAGGGAYSARVPPWLMPGAWQLTLTVTPPGETPLELGFQDELQS
jgi:hypothetical protein